MPLLTTLKHRLFPPIPIPPDVALRTTILRRQRVLDKLSLAVPWIRTALILAGFAYLLALPFPGEGRGKQGGFLGRGHYVSENALQPGQVNTYWNWADVHVADTYAEKVDAWAEEGVAPHNRADAIKSAFQTLGLPAATQSYSFRLGGANRTVSGVNTYAILQAPKTDGAEALVLSASWLSRALDSEGERSVNRRGVATLLAVANYVKKYSMWSKDIIFLVSDGYEDGAQAWLDAYHGAGQHNLNAEPLSLTTGPIWAALNLDYAYHSFSHIGLFYEGPNGHLPNLDFLNAASHILKHTGIPVLLHDDLNTAELRPARFVPGWLDSDVVRKYERSAANLVRQLTYGAAGRVSGPEGVYGRYRIDGLTFFAVPAEGPHGFHALGRAAESTLRSLNNLLERFHQSFFLYLMTSVETFIAVGNYLAAPILVSAGMTITGLSMWSDAAEGDAGRKRRRPIGAALGIIAVTHAIGAGLLQVVAMSEPAEVLKANNFLLAGALLLAPLALATAFKPTRRFLNVAPVAPILKSFSLITAGLAIAVSSTLNFGLACALALVLAPALVLAGPTGGPGLASARRPAWRGAKGSAAGRGLQQLALVGVSPPVAWQVWRAVDRVGSEAWLGGWLGEWHVVSGWSVGAALGVVVPLLMQAGVGVVLDGLERAGTGGPVRREGEKREKIE